MKGAEIPFGSKIAYTAGTAGGDAVLVLGTASGEQNVIDWVNITQSTGSNTITALTILSGTSTIFKTFVCLSTSLEGTQTLNFSPGLECGIEKAVTITRGAIAAITHELSAGYR